jgi:hypothetical protein
MTTATQGWAVLPSADSWVLLSTTDGWRHVSNASPLAVPTSGGLVMATDAATLAVAVGTYKRLTQSPLVKRDVSATNWSADELPGSVRDARGALSVTGTVLSAVLADHAGGTVLVNKDGSWRTVAAAHALDPSGAFFLDGITWLDASHGWARGHRARGVGPVVFETNDAGTTWHPVNVGGLAAVSALQPCGSGAQWLIPIVRDDHSLVVLATADSGASWSAGAALTLTSGAPVVGCDGKDVWATAPADSSAAPSVVASSDSGRSWRRTGAAPAHLRDLAPVGDGLGYATSQEHKKATLWRVSGDGSTFSKIPLPSWVATIGANEATS